MELSMYIYIYIYNMCKDKTLLAPGPHCENHGQASIELTCPMSGYLRSHLGYLEFGTHQL